MNFDLLFINGCSHSAGSEIEASGIGEGKFNRENCFGAQIAKKLNVDKINLAQPGGSNDYIANSTMLWCLSNIEKIKNTFFLIHWTSAERTDFYTNTYKTPKYQDWTFDPLFGHVHADHYCPNFDSEDLSYIKPLSKYLFINETHWEINKLLNIIKTQSLLKSHGAQYAFYNAFTPCVNNERYKNYHTLIDQENFKYMFEQKQTFYYWALLNGHSIDGQKYWHHKLLAHSGYANKLFFELFI
jgi:hypothetical protein